MNQTSLVGRPLAALTAAVVGFAERRGVWSGPLTSSSPELARLWGAPSTSTGVGVNEESSLTYSTVWACVNNISTDVASLPLILYKRLKDGGKERLTDHKLYRLLHDEPNPEMSSMTFRGLVQAHALTWGNGYAEIVRDGQGRVAELWPITPDRVTVRRDARGVVYYEVSRVDGRPNDHVPAVNMLHLQGLGYDGTVGYNLVAKARESIALGLATERFGGSFFGNGATFGGVFEHPGRMTEQAIKNFKASVNAQHQGVDKAHKFIVVEEGMKYHKLGIDPDHAQFRETREQQVEEICRYFRMPPHKVQHLLRSTNNNIEHQGIEYYSDTLRPWCVRWEQEIKRKLIAPSERLIQLVEHKIEGVLRGDLASRYAAYAVARQWGWMSADDICESENLNPLPNGQGKIYLVPMNMTPADRIGEIIDKQVAPDPKPVAPVASEPKDEPKDEADRARQMAEAIRSALTDVETRIAETTAKIVTAEAQTEQERAQNVVLLAQVEAERAEAGTLRSLLLDATERADRLALEQDAARMVEVTLQEKLTAADALMAETAKAHLDAQQRAEELEAERARLQAACVASTAQVEQVQADHARALLELATAAESERSTAEHRVTELRTLAAEAEQHRDAQIAELGQRDEALVAAQLRVSTLTTELDTLRTQALVAQRDADEAKASAITASAHALEAEQAHVAQLIAEQTERAALAKQLADVQAYLETVTAKLEATQAEATTAAQQSAAAIAHAEQARAEAVAAEQAKAAHAALAATEQTARTQAEAAMTALKAADAARTQALLTAHRYVIENEMAKLVLKETERARKNKGTPSKLKAWAESFYLLHEETCVDALRPAMRTHLVLVGSQQDVDSYTIAKIRPQLEAALAQIRAVANGDEEDFPVAIERLLTRWEQERPAAIADVVLQEEISYVRSL